MAVRVRNWISMAVLVWAMSFYFLPEVGLMDALKFCKNFILGVILLAEVAVTTIWEVTNWPIRIYLVIGAFGLLAMIAQDFFAKPQKRAGRSRPLPSLGVAGSGDGQFSALSEDDKSEMFAEIEAAPPSLVETVKEKWRDINDFKLKGTDEMLASLVPEGPAAKSFVNNSFCADCNNFDLRNDCGGKGI